MPARQPAAAPPSSPVATPRAPATGGTLGKLLQAKEEARRKRG
jgi:hypothetical protein